MAPSQNKVVTMIVVGTLIAVGLFFVLFHHNHLTHNNKVKCYFFLKSKIDFNPTLRVGPGCFDKCLLDRLGKNIPERTLARNGHNISQGKHYVFLLMDHYNIGAVDSERFTNLTAEFDKFYEGDIGSFHVETKNAFYINATDAWIIAGEYSIADNIDLRIVFWKNHNALMARVRSNFTSIRRNDGKKKNVNIDVTCPVQVRPLNEFEERWDQ